jgi:hypothetical protein
MDNVSLILTALESAIVAGGQSALNDTVKEAFLNLKNRIAKRLAGKHHSDIVLNKYEQDPETWCKPLTELLIEASLAEDKEVIAQAKRLLQLTRSDSQIDSHITNVFHGQVQGSAIGNNNTNTFHITNNTFPVENSPTRGRDTSRRGYNALTRGDYTAARHYLEEAEGLLPEDRFPSEAAQVKYLLALALLGGQRPFSCTIQIMRRIEQLLRSAIGLHALHSYYCTLALFKRDFARNGLPYYQSDAQDLARKAQRIHRRAIDEENLKLLAQCQPRLVSDSKNW